MNDPGTPRKREPYAPPVLRPLKLFVEAATPGCCKLTAASCSNAMKAQHVPGNKSDRTSTAS